MTKSQPAVRVRTINKNINAHKLSKCFLYFSYILINLNKSRALFYNFIYLDKFTQFLKILHNKFT